VQEGKINIEDNEQNERFDELVTNKEERKM
jgi:hypothetical protein